MRKIYLFIIILFLDLWYCINKHRRILLESSINFKYYTTEKLVLTNFYHNLKEYVNNEGKEKINFFKYFLNSFGNANSYILFDYYFSLDIKEFKVSINNKYYNQECQINNKYKYLFEYYFKDIDDVYDSFRFYSPKYNNNEIYEYYSNIENEILSHISNKEFVFKFKFYKFKIIDSNLFYSLILDNGLYLKYNNEFIFKFFPQIELSYEFTNINYNNYITKLKIENCDTILCNNYTIFANLDNNKINIFSDLVNFNFEDKFYKIPSDKNIMIKNKKSV